MPTKGTTPYVLIPLTRGKFATIDVADVERVCAHKWMAAWTGSRWYARRMDAATGKQVYLHRWLLNAPDDREVDHEDGDGLNCRRRNLREATGSQNLSNRGIQKNNQTGYKGVFLNRGRGRYTAAIRINNKRFHIGQYDTAEEAARAYDLKAIELHGEFAHLNFPD